MSNTQLVILLIATLVMFLANYGYMKILSDVLFVKSNLRTLMTPVRFGVIIAGIFIAMGLIIALGWKVYISAFILIVIAGIVVMASPFFKKLSLYFISVLIGLSGSVIYAVAVYVSDFYKG